MKEKEFLKQINNGGLRKSGDSICIIIRRLFEEENSLTIRRKINIFPNLSKRKSASQIVRENFQSILDNTPSTQLYKVLIILMEDAQTAEIVKDNFEAIIKRCSSNQLERDTNYREIEIRNLIMKWFLARCEKEWIDVKEILKEHAEFIMQEGMSLTNAQALQGLSKEIDEKLNRRLEETKGQVARELLKNSMYLSSKDMDEIKRLVEDYALTMETMVDELLVDQNARMIDIQLVCNGGYSQVYEIKDKVLKIGKPRETYEIPYHPRILQPLTRTNLIDEQNANEVFACVEIADNVERICENQRQAEELEKDEKALEKLYQIYKELRKDGIIWTDARFQNVGVLKKPNMPSLHGEEIDVDSQAIGIKGKTKGRILGRGEWVIIDTDFLYREHNCVAVTKSLSMKFEKRWEQEEQRVLARQYENNKGTRWIGEDKELEK